jgi:hypothetical protein
MDGQIVCKWVNIAANGVSYEVGSLLRGWPRGASIDGDASPEIKLDDVRAVCDDDVSRVDGVLVLPITCLAP